MQKTKRKSGPDTASTVGPKKQKINDLADKPDSKKQDKEVSATKKFLKTGPAAPQNKKGKTFGKPFQKNKEGSLKKKESSFQKNKEGSLKKKDPSFQKKKDGTFQKKSDGFQKGATFQKNKVGAVTEKPVWSEMKKQKKQLRLERRKSKATVPVFELSHKAKGLANQIQRKVVQPAVRIKLCTELHELLKGQYTAIALTHDLSRVIQVLLKASEENIRKEISEELLPIMVQMVQSKYAHHSVKRILKYGSDEIRSKVIERFYGNIVTLAAHSISAPVLDFAYGDHATQKQKLYMQQEFYGDIFKNSKEANVKSMRDAYKDSPVMKEAIISKCKANIQRVLDKNLHDGELLHAVLYNYISECTEEERAELITTLSPLIVPLSNSLPGVNAACMCVWQGTNKDKKTILKVVKEHAVALSSHKTGYRLLLAIFDSVDDTVLVRKAIVATLVKNIKLIAKNHWGKMTLHWLVKPNDTAAFHPSLIKQLKDGAASGTSKKNADLRVSELREAVIPPLCDEMKADPDFWLSDPTMALLTATVLSTGAPKEVMSAIVSVICRVDWTIKKDGKDVTAIEDAGMHVCLKKLAQGDKESQTIGFGEVLGEELTEATLKVWLMTNRGCFVLLNALENNSKEVVSKLFNKINALVKLIQKQTTQGAKLLLKHISA